MNKCYEYENIPQAIKNELGRANLFFSEQYYLNVLERGQKQIYVWSDKFILAARIKSKLFLKCALLESEPFMYAGESYNESDLEKFLNTAMAQLKKEKITWTITTNTARFQAYPDKSKVILAGNLIIDLTLSEEELWKNVHSKHRNSIRRGEKACLVLKNGGQDLIKEYTAMSNETYRRSNMEESSFEYFSSLISCLESNSKITIAYKDGEPQAAGMFLYNEAMAYYLHGASVSGSEPGSANYLLWDTIKRMKEVGVKKFSFVGYHVNPEPDSKLAGIQNFKSRFGGQLEYCFSFKYIHRPLGYKIYCLAMRLKSGKIMHKYKDTIDKQLGNFEKVDGRLEIK